MQITALSILTNNIASTKQFYATLLGFPVISESETQIVFQIGTSTLQFDLVEKHQHPRYHFAFAIPSNKITEAMEWMAQRTPLLPIAPGSFLAHFEDWKAKAFYFHDNNQNILECIARTDLHNPSDNAFSIQRILHISEIGLAADDPAAAGDALIQKTKTQYFAKGQRLADFTAAGDDHGLFVISRTGRNWYPTQQPAEKWKAQATVIVSGVSISLTFNHNYC